MSRRIMRYISLICGRYLIWRLFSWCIVFRASLKTFGEHIIPQLQGKMINAMVNGKKLRTDPADIYLVEDNNMGTSE